jgi:Lantibiotic biosynthesis dehydratase C-term
MIAVSEMKVMGEPRKPPTVEDVQARWISGHLYHHESLDRVVRQFVHPLAVSLVKGGEIDGFFFVRDGLGGPHVRLRLRAVPRAGEQVLAAMRQAAQQFLDLHPSARPLDPETIRRSNQHLLAADPHEIDDAVYPDNSFRVVPFRPEVQRYGGLDRLRASLDFFTLSSAAALEFLASYGDSPRSAQLTYAFYLLLQQALGFAADETELLDLLRYGVDSWGKALPKVVEKGDQVAQSQRDSLLELFQEGLDEARELRFGSGSHGVPTDFLVAGAGRLSAAIGTADRPTRARIGGSQLHMTATRIGLSNAEEVYVSRLLTATFGEARPALGERLSWLGAAGAAAGDLGALLPPALAALAEVPVRQPSV